MTHEEAKRIAQSAWDEAVAAAPHTCCDGYGSDVASYYRSRLDRMNFVAGYLKGAIASLLQDHASPEPVKMATGLTDVVYLSDVPIGVTGHYVKGCPATADDPGQGATFEVEEMYLMGYRLPDEIARPLAAHYQSAIDERMEEIHGDTGEPCPEWEVWE